VEQDDERRDCSDEKTYDADRQQVVVSNTRSGRWRVSTQPSTSVTAH